MTFRRFTGQENDEQREEIRSHPPDILLTNYVMLEYILTRPYDQALVRAAEGLSYLVLDELHTYRGRQGADVALLVRRVRDACKAPNLQCVGTSATLAGPGTYDEQRAEVARVASRLFGTTVEPEAVIGETLRPATDEIDRDGADFQSAAHATSQPSPGAAADLRGDNRRPAGVLDRAHARDRLRRGRHPLHPLSAEAAHGAQRRGGAARRDDGP